MWSVSTDKLAELQASLTAYCSQVSPRSDFYPTIGDICCAQFSGKEKRVLLNFLLTIKYQEMNQSSFCIDGCIGSLSSAPMMFLSVSN